MPTASEYEGVAAELGDLSVSVPEAFSKVNSGWNDAVRGGRLAVLIEEAVDASASMTNAIAGACQALADECVRRSVVCANHDQALREYYAKPAEERGSAPSPPASWVTPSVLGSGG